MVSDADKSQARAAMFWLGATLMSIGAFNFWGFSGLSCAVGFTLIVFSIVSAVVS